MPETTMQPDTSALPAIERRLEFRVSAARLWQALTDPNQLSSWFGTAADFRAEVGADGWFEWPEYGRFHCRVVAVEPGRHLAWRGAQEPNVSVDDGPTTLTEWWIDEAPDGGSILRLRESGFRDIASLEGNGAGWLEELADLADLLATEPWQRPIRRKLELRADRETVWRALNDPVDFRAWWGADATIEPGWEGWFDFPVHGRRAVRIEAVEPRRYVAWRWVADEKDVSLNDAREVLFTQWVLSDREDGGTDLQLLESGFIGPKSFEDNDRGWDHDVLPDLQRYVDKAAPARS
jgi:uncharacterized protein YndB with AHSA1/START domain